MGDWCKHCEIGHGCKIYNNKPKGCNDFRCRWLLGEFADSSRPDLVGIVVGDILLPRTGFGNPFALHEYRKGALGEQFAHEETARFIEEGSLVCHIPMEGMNILYLPQDVYDRRGNLPPGGYLANFTINHKHTWITPFTQDVNNPEQGVTGPEH